MTLILFTPHPSSLVSFLHTRLPDLLDPKEEFPQLRNWWYANHQLRNWWYTRHQKRNRILGQMPTNTMTMASYGTPIKAAYASLRY